MRSLAVVDARAPGMDSPHWKGGLDRYTVSATGCWIWTGYRNPFGYGCLTYGRYPRLAHRVMYERVRGPIPEGLTLDHFRLNPGPRQAPCSRLCVNPEHLEPVTLRENLLRGTSFSAVNARKMRCLAGHVYDDENTRITRSGRRNCRKCDSARSRRYYRVNHKKVRVSHRCYYYEQKKKEKE